MAGKKVCPVAHVSRMRYPLTLTEQQCSRFPLAEALGTGMNATVFQHAEDPDKVIKITLDAEDAKAARLIKGARHGNLVEIFDVAQLGKKDARGRQFYAIIAEKLKPLSEMEQLTVRTVSDYVQDIDDRWSDLAEDLGESPDEPSDFGLIAEIAQDNCENLGAEGDIDESEVRDCQRYLPQMAKAMRQMDGAGFRTVDLHGANWGRRTPRGELVLLDFGASRLRKVVPEFDLAGRPRRRFSKRKGR